jgi:hypothetical protein
MVYTMLNHWFVVTTTGALLKVEIAPKLALLQSGTEPVTLLNPPLITQTHESLASELLVLTASCMLGEFDGPYSAAVTHCTVAEGSSFTRYTMENGNPLPYGVYDKLRKYPPPAPLPLPAEYTPPPGALKMAPEKFEMP